MSPEALDASVSLQDPESFKQIDMYALALVLWEIASRCPANDGGMINKIEAIKNLVTDCSTCVA